MCQACKALLLAVLVGAVFASSAQAAQLEFKDYPGGTHCPAVTVTGTDVDGGCLIHVIAEDPGVNIRKHVFGIESNITTCLSEFMQRINEDGEGYPTEQILSGAGCTRQPCKDGSGESLVWHGLGFEGTPEGTVEGNEYMTTVFCIEPVGGGTGESCTVDIPFNAKVIPGTYEFGHLTDLSSHSASGFRCELNGHWSMETGTGHDGENVKSLTIAHAP